MEKITFERNTIEKNGNVFFLMKKDNKLIIGDIIGNYYFHRFIYTNDEYLSDYDNFEQAIDLFMSDEIFVNIEQDKIGNYLITERETCKELYLQSESDKKNLLDSLSQVNSDTLITGYNLYEVRLPAEYLPDCIDIDS